MKKVLIATTNKDKFSAVSKIFKATIFHKDEFIILSLDDINIVIKDEEEHGSNIERARKKAKNVYNQVNEFDYIVGLDDAIKINDKIEPNIKEYINKILFENYISDGEKIVFNRAYCIIDKEENVYETTADIPYIYHPLKEEYKLKSHTYPLSKVAYPIGYNKPICDMSGDEELNYYLKYVKDKIENIDIK